MNFRFNITKGTEVACQFLQREEGRMNIMKLAKLVYLLDRLSLSKRGIPVVGGVYFSMPNGPVTSELLDLINSGCLWGEHCRWEEFISDRRDHEIALRKVPECEHLSEAELELIDQIYQQFGSKDQWELRDWCHERCAEWTPLNAGRDRIEVERIGEALGKGRNEIEQMKEEAEELNLLSKAFAAG